MQAFLHPIPPIDTAIGGTIRFSWNGNQVFRNQCIIKSMETGETVYDNTTDSFKYEHPIDLSLSTMENGNQYIAYIIVFDKDGTPSELQSIGTPFYCFSTPTFQFTNITDGQIIRNSTFRVNCQYAQSEGELLDSWSIVLYDHSKMELSSTGVVYETEDLSYLTPMLNNKTTYYLRAIGKTVHGILVDTGYLEISVTYDISSLFSLIELTNLPDIGAIQLRSNIIASEGHTGKTPVFLGGEFIDLRDDYVKYTEGFILGEEAGDGWSLVWKAYQIAVNKPIHLLFGDGINGILYHRITRNDDGEMLSYLELNIVQDSLVQVLMSNLVPRLPDNRLAAVCITCQNQLFEIQLKDLEVDI